MNKDTKSILAAIVISLTILAVTSVGYLVAQKALKDHAITECLRISSVVSFSGDEHNSHKYTEPLMNWYNKCMEEKGYK